MGPKKSFENYKCRARATIRLNTIHCVGNEGRQRGDDESFAPEKRWKMTKRS
jgi:hypothetical protein